MSDFTDLAVVIRPMMRRRVPLPLDRPVELKAGETRISLTATERATLAVLFGRDMLTIGELRSLLTGIEGPEVGTRWPDWRVRRILPKGD